MKPFRKKVVYWVLALPFIAGGYLVLRFAFGIFAPYNYFTAKAEIKKGKIRMIETGELPPNSEQKQTLAKTYGFEFEPAGCAVTAEIINGVNQHNKLMIKELEKGMVQAGGQNFSANWII